jgi:glutathione S-transferase
MKLLGRKTSGNVQKVLWLLEELKMPYTREDYGRQFNNTQTPEYLKMNPNAKVPTLVDGDLVIWESNTILRYLATKAKSPLYPADAAKRSQVERWMDWQLASTGPPHLSLFRGTKLPPAERAADFAPAAKEMADLMRILDTQLAGRGHIALDRLSLADIALGTTIHRWFSWDIERPSVPNLEGWYRRMHERPAFKKHVVG